MIQLDMMAETTLGERRLSLATEFTEDAEVE